MVIVTFENDYGCTPYTWCDVTPGAIVLSSPGDAVAVFKDKVEAKKAIRISTLQAQLRTLQDLPANTDFTTDRKYIRIVPLKFQYPPGESDG